MANLAYEIAVRGRVLPSSKDFTPYVITLNRNSRTPNYTALKSIGVIAAVFEAGYLFDSIHIVQTRYKSPVLDDQVQLAIDNSVPYGLYADVRARSVDEAKQELYELARVIRRHPPQIGMWLRLLFNNPVATNNKILDTYYDYFVRLGLQDQVGLYVTSTELSRITWDNYYEKWYLWLIDHPQTLSNLNELLTPQFFMVN